MEVQTRLREIGYTLAADGENIKCSWRGAGKPDPNTVYPLLEELRSHKAEALAALREETAEPSPYPDPFDEGSYSPPGLIICMPDLDRPGCWTARRTGTLKPVGHGPDQVEAILDLGREETLH